MIDFFKTLVIIVALGVAALFATFFIMVGLNKSKICEHIKLKFKK